MDVLKSTCIFNTTMSTAFKQILSITLRLKLNHYDGKCVINHSKNSVKFPRIHLSKFDGIVSHYLELKDAFWSLISKSNWRYYLCALLENITAELPVLNIFSLLT